MTDPIRYLDPETLNVYAATRDSAQLMLSVRQFAVGMIAGLLLATISEALEPGPMVLGVPRLYVCAALGGLLLALALRAERVYRRLAWRAWALRTGLQPDDDSAPAPLTAVDQP